MNNKHKKILIILGISFGILIIGVASVFIVVNHNRKKAEEKAKLEKLEETVNNETNNDNTDGSAMIPSDDGAFIDEEPYNENPVVSNTQESKYLADRLGYKVGDKLDGLFTYKGEDIFLRDSDGIKFKMTYDENNQIILTPVQNNNVTGNNSNSNSNSGNKKPSNNTGNNNNSGKKSNNSNNNNSSSNNDDGPTSGFIPEEDGWTDGSDDTDWDEKYEGDLDMKAP